MDIHQTVTDLKHIKLCKMNLIYNSLESGWTIKKRDKSYIFTKNHEGKKEVLSDNYLKRFMKANCDIENLISIKTV